MAKREVKRSFTFEQQRQEINLLADDLGDREQLDTLSTEGQSSLVEAINEVIDTPEDEVFVSEVVATNAEQKILFADESTFVESANYVASGKASGTNPESADYAKLAYDAGRGVDEDRFTYNSQNQILRVNNVKADIRNRNSDEVLDALGQEVLDVNTDVDGHSPSETARLTGRLRTKATNSPIEIQKNLIKLEESARMQITNSSAIDLFTGVDVGAYVNVTNNKKILYVSADDENASDLPTNDGSNINRPFKSIERALIEAAKRSYVAPGAGNEIGEPGADLFENFTILLFPGEYIIDNTPGVDENGVAYSPADIEEEIKSRPGEAYHTTASFADELKKFNPPEGGLIVPRGTSIVGLDLRKTLIRPKYVPDPADVAVKNSCMFRLTGACYIWQFTIKDNLSVQESHHKLTAFEFASYDQLELYYKKIDKYSRKDESTNPPAGRYKDAENLLLDNKRFIAQLAVAYVERNNATLAANVDNPSAVPGETIGEACVDDVALLIEKIAYNLAHGGNNRVVDAAQFYIDNPVLAGEEPESKLVFEAANEICQYVIKNYNVIEDKDGVITRNFAPGGVSVLDTTALNVDTAFAQQIYDFNLAPDVSTSTSGYEIDDNTDPANCSNVASAIDTLWTIITDTVDSIINDPTPSVPEIPINPTGEEDYNQRIEENRIVGFVQNKYLSDTVASASPYVFNISLRSVWGLCGLLSDGAQSTGLRSMVLAQYTGISLQRDDRAFILNGTTTEVVDDPDQRHTVSIAEYRSDWRHYHIKSTNNSFLQIVSVFAVGQADHFTVETGGDHSITNSNSNFGNQSLIAVSHRTEVFKQDNGAYIVGLVPPRGLDSTRESRVNIYNIDFGSTLARFKAADENDATDGFRKIYLKVGGESLIKEGDIPEYYSIIPGTNQEQAELLLDDVNYLLGKRRYSDGFPEAVYARLPKNFEQPELVTYASRLRDNQYLVPSPQVYDPRDTYSEGKILTDGAGVSGGSISAAAIETSVKNFYALDPTINLNSQQAGFGTTNLITNTNLTDAGFATNSVYFGAATSGGSAASTTRYKLIIGQNISTFLFAITEGNIKTIACQGTSQPSSGTDPDEEYVVYQAVSGIPQSGQIQYTYTQVDYGAASLNAGRATGQGARFNIYRTKNESRYVVEILAAGVTYNIGDTFTIDGADLGGFSSSDPAGHVLTVDLLNGGTGYTVANNVATTGGAPGSGLTVDILEVDGDGTITKLRVNNGGSGYNAAGGAGITISQSGNTSATAETAIVEADPSTTNNDLVLHVVANSNSGEGIGRGQDYIVTFDDPVDTDTLSVRMYVTDVTLPTNVSIETNDLYTFDSISDEDYTIPSGGFDARYIFSLSGGVSSPSPWQHLGQFVNGVSAIVTSTIITKNRIVGGSGFTADAGFNTITFPGSYLGGSDGLNDFTVTISSVGGATINTLNFNDDDTPKRRYYGWEFARTVNGEFYGRLAILVDDERKGASTVIYGIPGEFNYTNTGILFNGYSTETTIAGSATTIPDLQFTRTITSIQNNSPGSLTFTITVSNPTGKPAHPFFKGDLVYFDNTNANNGQSLVGPYVVRERIGNTSFEISVSNAASLPATGQWIVGGDVYKFSKEITIPVKVVVGNIVNLSQGEVTDIYPNDWVINAVSQNYESGWTSSGSELSYDDQFILDTGANTPFLPQQQITFTILENLLITRGPLTYSSAGIKEEGYLSGSALGVDYKPYDNSKTLEENTFVYSPENSTDNETLSLFRRITQKVDTNPVSGALEKSDGFEFNNNIINSLYVKRIQDSRAANGNNELLWRLICKLPKDGYNNIKLRAPEGKFILHLKDPGIGFGDETLDFPFVYDSQHTGVIRDIEVLTLGTNQTAVAPTATEFIKTVKRGGTGAYVNYNLIDTSNTPGAEILQPSGATFTVSGGEVTIVSPGQNYNNGDRITLPGGTIIKVTKAVSTYPKTFYIRQVEPIVEYEYNSRDGYYLLTMLDGNVYEEYDLATDSVSNNTKTITYGKQRLIGLEELSGDGIANEVNHLKQDGSDLIEKNRLFIQQECAGFIKAESQSGQQFAGFVNPDADRCSRDVGHLLNGIIKDLRQGGNNNTISNAQYYFSTGTQKFIETELPQTRAVFEYAKHLAIASIRNFDFWELATAVTSTTTTAGDSLTLQSTDGIVEGMEVYETTGVTTLPSNQTQYNAAVAGQARIGWVGRVNRSTNVVTVFTTGVGGINKNRNLTRIGSGQVGINFPVFRFRMVAGMGDGDWRTEAATNTTEPVIDNTLIIDYDHATGECQSVVNAVNVLYDIHDEILTAEEADVTASANIATFNSASLTDGAFIRIFGAQNAAFNGEDIEVSQLSPGVFTYDLAVSFPTITTDKILYYVSSVNYTEPTKASYDTEEIYIEGLGYSQNINYLYPELDLDNPKWNPLPSVSQYRKEVGNTIIRDNELEVDDYERISQYSITAESTKKILNSILTGGAGATGYNVRSYSEIDLESEFQLSSYPGSPSLVTDDVMQAPYGPEDSRNEYGVPKSPVLEFTSQNVPIFTDRCILFDKAVPVSFYRPSIIRASSHTWEYVGFGPGNYSTGLPQFQDITLTQQELVNSQTAEYGGGFVASSGTNSVGDFYIGNQVIDAKGNQSNTLNFPRVKTSAENRLIDYANLDSLAGNSSTASFNPSSFSAILTNDLQAIQEAQRNSFKASNIESSILTTGTLKINNKISIANNVFENEDNFPVARQDVYGFTKRSPINWFNTDPATDEYQDLADTFISPTDLADWANVNSLIPSQPVAWEVVFKTNTFNEVSNVGDVNINSTLTKSVNFAVSGIDPIDERWYDAVTDTISIPLGTPVDNVNNTTLATYDGRAGQIYITFPNSVKAAAIIPTNIWKPLENTWTGVSPVDGSPTTYIQGDKFVISYYIASGQIIYSVSTLDA